MEKNDISNTFLQETLNGLQANPKYLLSKYFYDETGDKIFQEIMDSPEYYVSKVETEIFQSKSEEMAKTVNNIFNGDFDVIELGAGDATKSIYLLKALLNKYIDNNWFKDTTKTTPYSYFPIDISEDVIHDLHRRLPEELPGVRIFGIVGEYLEALKSTYVMSSKPKLILFIGSSIGNFTVHETKRLFHEIHSIMKPHDMILTGFDLRTGWGKTPEVILAAYNDKAGITKRFNLNLLTRMNKSLGTNFDITKFEHTPTYNSTTGECKSYLKSLVDQEISIGWEMVCKLKKDELIYTEISQKYTIEELEDIAMDNCFSPLFQYSDTKGWYVDVLWEAR